MTLDRAVKGVRNCLSSEGSHNYDLLIIGMMISVDCSSVVDRNHLSISVIYPSVEITETGSRVHCDETCETEDLGFFQLVSCLGLSPMNRPSRQRRLSASVHACDRKAGASTLSALSSSRPRERNHHANVHALRPCCPRPRRRNGNLDFHSLSSSVDEDVAVPQSLEPSLFWLMSPDFAHHLQVWS